MKYYAYKMAHDYGFAPNPFGTICTLATCKPKIRIGAQIGDWVIGSGSKEMGLEDRLIYIMEVTGKLTHTEYWHYPDFQFKKPLSNGSLVRQHGDNIYFLSHDGRYNQLSSLHSEPDGSQNAMHTKRDIGGKYVLLSTNFFYFGDKNFSIPKKFWKVHSHVRDTKIIDDTALAAEFIAWIKSQYTPGIIGFPVSWINYRQLKLLF